MIRSGKYFTRNNWYAHARTCKDHLALAGRPRLERGKVITEQQQATATQVGPSLPSSMTEEADQARPPRARRQRPAARKAATKRKALDFDDESGGEIEKERKIKVYIFMFCARSPLLMCNVFYRESSATAPDRAVCLL